MVASNRERVGHTLELLRAGLYPFVDRTMRGRRGSSWAQEFSDRGQHAQLERLPDGSFRPDTLGLLRAIDRYWGEVFSEVLDRVNRSLANELIDVRNKYAHDEPFTSTEETRRAVDTAKRLLEAVGATEQAKDIGRTHDELMRLLVETQPHQTAIQTVPRSLQLVRDPPKLVCDLGRFIGDGAKLDSGLAQEFAHFFRLGEDKYALNTSNGGFWIGRQWEVRTAACSVGNDEGDGGISAAP